MCLTTTQKRAKIAKEDIVCYKILKKTDDGIKSPYYNFIWDLDVLYETKIGKKEVSGYGLYDINKGFHTISNMYEAITERAWIESVIYIKNNEEYNINIYKSIIPKGSKYYISYYDDQYVSNQLIIKELYNDNSSI